VSDTDEQKNNTTEPINTDEEKAEVVETAGESSEKEVPAVAEIPAQEAEANSEPVVVEKTEETQPEEIRVAESANETSEKESVEEVQAVNTEEIVEVAADKKQSDKKAEFTYRVGDTVSVAVKIKEGDRERLQNFEGVIIAMKGKGISRTFTIRRIGVGGIGVERIWPIDCPSIASIKMVKRGHSNSAKMYYLRGRTGKRALKVRDFVEKPVAAA